jgi:hypothetical protein
MDFKTGDQFYDTMSGITVKLIGWLISLIWSVVLFLITSISRAISRIRQSGQERADEWWQPLSASSLDEDETTCEDGIFLGQPIEFD